MTDAAPFSVPLADERDVTYHGLPSVKPSLWGGLVSGYMFIVGVGGSAEIIATAADAVGYRVLAQHISNCTYTAIDTTELGRATLTVLLLMPLVLCNSV